MTTDSCSLPICVN